MHCCWFLDMGNGRMEDSHIVVCDDVKNHPYRRPGRRKIDDDTCTVLVRTKMSTTLLLAKYQ
jgi:hypothetical protein